MPTPDRKPGPLIEEKIHFDDEGHIADTAGDMVYASGAFSMRDSIGAFNPRASCDSQYFDGYDSAGGLNFSSGWADIPLNGERKKTSGITHSGSSAEITISEAGTYVILGRVGYYQNGGNGRSIAQMRILLDTGSGFAELAGSQGYGYSRNDGSGEGGMEAFAILDLSSGYKLKLQANRYSGAGVLITIANGSSLLLFTTKGPRGDQGIPGAGTTLTMQGDGVSLPNTPHSILNIAGTGYTFEDGGSGEAKLTLSGGGLDYDRAIDLADFINQIDYGWGAGVAGTGAYQVLEALGGQFELDSGATSGGAVSIQQDLRMLSVNSKFAFICRGKQVDVSGIYVEFGVQSGSGQYAVFSNDGATGNWRARNSAGGAETSTDDLATPDTSWHIFEMNCNGSQIEYIIDGSTVAAHTTNLPTVMMYGYCYIASTMAGSKKVIVDYFRTESDRET